MHIRTTPSKVVGNLCASRSLRSRASEQSEVYRTDSRTLVSHLSGMSNVKLKHMPNTLTGGTTQVERRLSSLVVVLLHDGRGGQRTQMQCAPSPINNSILVHSLVTHVDQTNQDAKRTSL